MLACSVQTSVGCLCQMLADPIIFSAPPKHHTLSLADMPSEEDCLQDRDMPSFSTMQQIIELIYIHCEVKCGLLP